MEIKRRLKKIENKINSKEETFPYTIITAYSDEDAEQQIQKLKQTYGESFREDKIIVILRYNSEKNNVD